MAAIVVTVPLVVAGTAGAAQAADTWTCAAAAAGYAVDSTTHLWRYPLTKPGTTTAAHGTRVDLGGGWNIYPRVLGGPDSKVYGINSTGLFRYRNIGTGWEVVGGHQQNWKISTGFGTYALPANRDKITIDEIGDFYSVDASGQLLLNRFDERTETWTISDRVISTDWSRYNLIFAGGPGVIYGRTPAGQLFRSRYEPTSQRWLQEHVLVGNGGWQQYTKGIFAVGGDTIYAPRTSNGELAHYRYREDNNTWPVQNRIAGESGWQNFTNTGGNTNSCGLTDQHTVARPVPRTEPNSATVAIQRPATGTQLGPIEYAYTDIAGRLRHGFQSTPDDFGQVTWSVVPTDGEAFTGRPALTADPQGNVNLLAQNTNSDAWSFVRQAEPSPNWSAGKSLGGALASRPATVRLSDGTPAAFGLDADGSLWSRRYIGTGDLNLLPWRKLGGAGLTGELTVVADAGRKAVLFALDANGTPVTATYLDGTLSAWTGLGGSGFTATPAAVPLPGHIVRVFARAADGRILSQVQSSGGTFPGVWTPVGTFTSAGPPAAVLDPPTARMVVFARGTDNEIYRVFEAAPVSGTWGDWRPLLGDVSDPSVTDPTVTEFKGSVGDSYMIIFRNQNDATRVYTRNNVVDAPSFKATAKDPEYVGHTLPAPPK